MKERAGKMAKGTEAEETPGRKGIAPEAGLLLAILVLGALLLFPLSPVVMSQVDNASLESRVNVTNVAPAVEQVQLYSRSLGPGNNIVLTEGTTTHVICNATISDGNGWRDINITHGSNATIWDFQVSDFDNADDNNDHYTNASCTMTEINASTASYTCSFEMAYYANNGTWMCNVSTRDAEDDSSFNISNATIDSLFAINVSANITHQVIDFGNMIPDNTTTDIDERLVNITNTGNVNISFAVDGWGENFGDNLAMNCTIGNISSTNLRYDVNNNTLYANMYNLTRWAPPLYVPISNGSLLQRTIDSDTGMINSTNTTYWKLRVPPGVKGFCNGTVIISAVSLFT